MESSITEIPLPSPSCSKRYAVFKCKVDRKQYLLPIVLTGLLCLIIFISTSDILYGILGMLPLPFLILVLFMHHYLWDRVTYTIDENVLRVSTPLNSVVINIGDIKKIRRGKFWVERGRNYSASYIKLRVVYDKSNYIYVSPVNEKSFVDLLLAINPDITYSCERSL